MPKEQVAQMLEQVTQVAAAEGLEYNFDSLQHTNTMRAHELLHFAKAHGKQAELKERSEEHTSELQSRGHLVCRLLLEKKKKFALRFAEASGKHSTCSVAS